MRPYASKLWTAVLIEKGAEIIEKNTGAMVWGGADADGAEGCESAG